MMREETKNNDDVGASEGWKSSQWRPMDEQGGELGRKEQIDSENGVTGWDEQKEAGDRLRRPP